MIRLLRNSVLGIAVLFSAPSVARESLPEPLPLEFALRLAVKSTHPDLMRANALMVGAEAERAVVDAESGLEVGVVAGLKWVDPPDVASDQDHNDSYLKLNVKKRLYDFGRSEAGVKAAEAALEGSYYRLLDARQRRYIDTMGRFFDVILADLRYARDNEAMATAYVTLDKARDRLKLKQISDYQLLKLEMEYQQVRGRVTASSNRQRGARAALALAMNRPGELSSELKMPITKGSKRPLPELEKLSSLVLARNPLLKALRADVTKERELAAKADAEHGPVLSGSLGAAAYQRDMGGYNPLSAELTLEIPLYSGGRKEAKVAKARSNMLLKSSEARAAELKLRQRVTDLWLELQELKVKRDELTASADYRELKMDRSRLLYQMEVNTDLGDSMVAISQQRLDEARLKFRTELVWAELDALAGRLLPGR